MRDRAKEKVISLIDLGTNSVRLLIVRLNPNHSYSVLRRQKEVIRLGEGSFAQGLLSEEAIERTIGICRQFTVISKSFGAEDVIAVATSAARDAKNGPVLIKRLKTEANLDIKVISGEEEARLIYLGVSSGLNLDEKPCLFIDIGGGSTEIIFGNRSDHLYLESLKIGALRTYYTFLNDSDTGIIDNGKFEEISRYIQGNLTHMKQAASDYSFAKAYGSSGTIRALISVAKNLRNKRETGNEDDYIGIGEIEAVTKRLCSMNVEERGAVPGINPARADISATSAIMLYIIMKELSIDRLYSTDRSLRDGLLFDYLSRQAGFSHTSTMPVKERSVRSLGRSCRIDETHAEKVVELSRRLFNSAGGCGLHDYGPEELELLEYAAYLHDVGQFISFSKHQNHSYYIITNAPLLGFNQSEIEIIGLIAKYHRKKAPKERDSFLKDLDKEMIDLVKICSLFLRIAEQLEKSHDGRVKDVYFSKDADALSLNIESDDDCIIELWSLADNLDILERIFAQNITTVVRK